MCIRDRYSGQVKDSNGDAVDNEMGYDSSSGRYSKVIQPIGEAEKNSLKNEGVSDDIIASMNSITSVSYTHLLHHS